MIKRLTDLILATLGLVILSPLFLLVAIAVKLADGGPVFFQQRRIGFKGKPFYMFKFRTMIVDAEKKGASLTVGIDSRITKPGVRLRQWKIDELPQLINVLLGHMSLVGPRPEVARYVDRYSPAQRQVLELKPGITDPASFVFFDESELLARVADAEKFYVEQLMGEKIRINLEYARQASFFTDLVLMLVTVGKIVGVQFDVAKWLGIEAPKFKLS